MSIKPYGQVRQLAWITSDIGRAMAHWSRVLGAGPWFYKEHVAVTTFRYKGSASPPPVMSIAFANSGELQLEIIQQRNDVPSMYRDFILKNGDGMQHVAFWTTDFDAVTAQIQADGYTEGHAGQIGQRGRFAYFEHPDLPGTVIEISEQTGGKAEFFREIREAAAGWDGSDPIRPRA